MNFHPISETESYEKYLRSEDMYSGTFAFNVPGLRTSTCTISGEGVQGELLAGRPFPAAQDADGPAA